jgi:prepilin-type processing-associated H-X9-DG protein/prepilin-type N-terminal cleavage/methylation domain-containing protein
MITPPQRLRALRGFTLVELLVVVGIIAILIAVISVSSTSVLATARTSKCAGNLHAIGAAFLQFAADNNNCLPQRFYTTSNPEVGYSGLLLPYLGNNGAYFVCPSAPSDWPTQPAYGMNWYYDNANLLTIHPLDQTILATDVNGTSGYGSNRADENSGDPGELAPTRHNGQANYLFMDGHVDRLPYSATIAPINLWGTDQGNHNANLAGGSGGN